MTHRDDAGNVQVDFVWGNMPMQPNDDRYDNYVYINGPENVGWSGSQVYYSDSLHTADYYVELNNLEGQVPADSHTIATTGWSNFPAFIPNYAGDGDAQLEQVVPNLVGKSLAQASYELDKINLELFAIAHNPTIEYIESTGKTVRVYAYDNNRWDDNVALVGLKVGDKVWVDNNLYGFGDLVTITNLTNDGENSWIEFETATELNLDDYAAGTIWPGPDLVNVITLMRFWNQPGDIKNEGTRIHVRYLGEW